MPRGEASTRRGGSGSAGPRDGPGPGDGDGRDGRAPGRVAAVALGSNLGDRRECLRFAVRELERRLERTRCSGLYRSRPREGVAGGPFLNACVAGRLPDDASPRELLRELLFVELGAGRPPRREGGAARTLDLDLLLVGDRVVRTDDLRLPHPRLHERSFVLRPLAELLPEWRHPERGESVRAMAERVGAADAERIDGSPGRVASGPPTA